MSYTNLLNSSTSTFLIAENALAIPMNIPAAWRWRNHIETGIPPPSGIM